jgi:hypothetical protein
LVAVAALAPSLAHAQPPPSDADVAIARKLVIDGNASLARKDYAQAESQFGRADALYHAPTIALGLARARAGLGKLVGAQEAYNRVVHTTVPPDASEAFVQAIADARTELAALTPRVPSLILQVKGGSAPKVTVDTVEVPAAALGEPRPADPGKHVVRATAPGFATSEVTVTLVEGKTETVTLELKPGENVPSKDATPGAPAEPPPSGDGGGSVRGPIGFAAIGVGAAGLVVGVATGVVGLGKQSDLLKHCPNGACPSNSMGMYGSEVSTYQTMSTVSTVALVVGGALAVTGIILVATAPKRSASKAAITPVLGPLYFGLQGKL